MKRTANLTEGHIAKTLFKLALPIMGTSFVQMAYSFIDMIWVGKIGSDAVASVGTVGFFTWLASAFVLVPKIGAEVNVAQAVGMKDHERVKEYVRQSLQIGVFLALLYGMVMIVFRNQLIAFFNLGDENVIKDAVDYLVIISLGFVCFFINPVFTAIFNGHGDSRTPFLINSIGLVINVLLDPLLIFGIGPFPRLEVKGAAIATVIAQVIASSIFLLKARKLPDVFSDIHFFRRPKAEYVLRISKIGIPSALQSGLFAIIAMIIARIIAGWGTTAIAVQKVGSQIESISWLTAGGFQSAMSAFIGQNLGARKLDRVKTGYFVGLAIVSVIGVFATVLLFFFAEPLFAVFVEESETITLGIDYLRILAASQLFMCIEITTAGAFYGLGKPFPPPIVGISFNALRIPMAIGLSATSLGLNGIWWAISISSILKGTVLTAWYIILIRKRVDHLTV